MGLTSALATRKGSERCRFAGWGVRTAEHLLEALLGGLCPPCPSGLGTGLPIPAEPQALSCCWLTAHCPTTETWSRLENRKVGQAAVPWCCCGVSVLRSVCGSWCCYLGNESETLRNHRSTCVPALPCRDTPSCPAGPWGGWVASAQTSVSSAAPRPIVEVTAPWGSLSPGQPTLQCPQKHHEARAPLSSRGSEQGISHPQSICQA